MHEMKHTPEPWGLHPAYHPNKENTPNAGFFGPKRGAPGWNYWNCTISSGDKIVAECAGWDEGLGGFPKPNNPEEVAANARRIIACVNGCAGINPEAVPDLLAALDETLEEMESLMAERAIPYQGGINIAERARAAIAKAKATEP